MIKKNAKRKEEQSSEGGGKREGREGRKEGRRKEKESKREKRTVGMYCSRILSWLVTALFP